MLQGKRVAVVGRASSILGTGQGKEIDAADVVVRVNWLLPIPPEQQVDVGSRTDILYATGGAKRARDAAKKYGVHIRAVNVQSRRDLAARHYTRDTHPTSGVAAIFEALVEGAVELRAYGFDFFDSAHIHARRPEGPGKKLAAWVHDPDLDAHVLRWLAETDIRFHPDAVLRRALERSTLRRRQGKGRAGVAVRDVQSPSLAFECLRVNTLCRLEVTHCVWSGPSLESQEVAWRAGEFRRFYRGALRFRSELVPAIIEVDTDGPIHVLFDHRRTENLPSVGEPLTLNLAP